VASERLEPDCHLDDGWRPGVLGDLRGPDAKFAPGLDHPQPNHTADLAAGGLAAGWVLPPAQNGHRRPNSVSSHTLAWAEPGMVTTTVSWWVGGSGATTRYVAVV
jgi:hypothetical protein